MLFPDMDVVHHDGMLARHIFGKCTDMQPQMATGGVANVIYHVPYRFNGLYTIGCIFFIFNLVLFVFNVTMISCRFYLYPHTFKASFLHPTESLFIPAWVISLGTIMVTITEYGIGQAGPWLKHTMCIMFWIYCALAILFSLGIYRK